MSSVQQVKYRESKKGPVGFEIVDIQVFYATRPHEMLSKESRQNFWTLIYITDGSGTHSVDFEVFNYKAGDLIVVQKNQVQRYVINKDVKGFIINLDENFFINQEGISRPLFNHFFYRPYKKPVLSVAVEPTSSNHQLIEILYNEYKNEITEVHDALLRSVFQSLVLAWKRFEDNGDKRLDKATYRTYNAFRLHVEENFAHLKTVEEYAQLMRISKKTINLATREIVGMSAKQFIIQRLLLEIKRYLVQGDLLNYQIADLLGFDEPANMTKFFKRYQGISPKQFREENG